MRGDGPADHPSLPRDGHHIFANGIGEVKRGPVAFDAVAPAYIAQRADEAAVAVTVVEGVLSLVSAAGERFQHQIESLDGLGRVMFGHG